MDQAEAKHLFEPTGDFQCLHEFIPAARTKLSDHVWGYLVGATETETTLRRNRLAIDSLALRPRVCVDVSKIDTAQPVRQNLAAAGFSGAGRFAGVVRSRWRGDRRTSRLGVRRRRSWCSSVTHPGLRKSPRRRPGPKIFQFYVRGDNAWVDDVVKRAVDHGYDAFAITVDTAAYSRRERDIAGRFRQAVARGRDRTRLPGRIYLGQRQALQGQAFASR